MRNRETMYRWPIASLGLCLTLAACGDDGNAEAGETGSSETAETETDSMTGDGDGDPATGDGDGDMTGDGDGDGDMTGDGDGDMTGDGDGDMTGDGDGDMTGDGDGDMTGDGDGDGDMTGDGDGDQCVPSEDIEVTCDNLDNDCDGLVDNVDEGADGFCDCLNIGILGSTGFNPTADFVDWLEEQGTTVTRTSLANNPGVVTQDLVATYDVLIIDRIERALSPEEAAVVEAFVKDGGYGMITLIGYNFDNNNPAPERDRANSALTPFGLAYQGPYLHSGGGNNVTPTFDPMHPVSEGVIEVNYIGGIEPVDNGDLGDSFIFATVPEGDAGLAHQTDGDGGRIVVWGDEWLTFDSDWQGYADVETFWSQMINWVKPADFCIVPPT